MADETARVAVVNVRLEPLNRRAQRDERLLAEGV
jgi:hypothetical protein